MIIGIIIGLLVWFVVPMFFSDGKKKKRKSKRQRIIEQACRIIGIVIIVASVVQSIFHI